MEKTENTKESIRKDMKEKRKAYPEALRRLSSHKISMNIFELPEFKNANVVCVYMAAFGEVDLKEVISKCKEQNKKVAAPITDEKTNTVSLAYIGEVLKKGAYGIFEPSGEKKCEFGEVDLVLVPGICFSRVGGRIGFGKGYYDRFLKDTTAYKLGVCYDFQILDEFEILPYDVAMDAIVSEEGVIKMK